MSPEDQYPSTTDMTSKPVGSRLLDCLRNARERIVLGHSTLHYLANQDDHLVVCAIGAVWAEDITVAKMHEIREMHDGVVSKIIDQYLSEVVKAAIELLNLVAVEKFPDAATNAGFWSGPLEWVNQREYSDLGMLEPEEVEPEEERIERDMRIKRDVLAIYDEAIARCEALAR